MDYRDAGVDINAGRNFVDQIKGIVAKTARAEVMGGLGGFGGLFRLPTGYEEPVLVSGTDGVGTKLQLAHRLNRHNTVGIDLVAMCVNDVLTCGAEPLFFLDYVAVGKLDQQQMVQVVAGIAQGCEQSGCALLGGETAEMPGFYEPHEYDLAGFCVGIVEHRQIIDGSRIQVGDVAIGVASTGVHSNGFSLVRKIVQDGGFAWSDRPELLAGQTLGEVLLTPTQLYVKPILELLRSGYDLRGMAHITGGGLPENLPRCLPPGVAIEVDSSAWPVPHIFDWLALNGDVPPAAMFNTFNMGIGFVVVLPADEAPEAIARFSEHQLQAYAIGQVVAGEQTLQGLPV